LRAKALKLTAYLEQIVHDVSANTGVDLKIITPSEAHKRGCQLSVVVPSNGKEVFNKLSANGVMADWREPDVIRLAPVPLYNSFSDVYEFGQLLENFLKD
jgi:kynureninase